jgi:hypothetical protein
MNVYYPKKVWIVKTVVLFARTIPSTPSNLGEGKAFMKPMKLADYLDMFSWSQADLARAAEVSTHCISRAINGKPIARRNAQKILEALTWQFREQGGKGHIGMGSIKGLQIASLQHNATQSRQTKEPLAADLVGHLSIE